MRFFFLISTQDTNTREANGHLDLVMTKLDEITINLEGAIDCTWPRTLRNERRVLLWPLLPQIGPN